VNPRLVATVRFQVPEPPPAFVPRARLVERIAAVTAPTTLVVGAPGAGKTAALAAWVTGRSAPTVWLSGDPTDADPGRFWTALALAIQRTVPGAGADALKRLEDDTAESVDLAASLAADCEFVPGLAIVVDDFHHAGTTPAVFSAFVRSLPAGVRLVLASRRDPSFPVGRLRVQGRLLELRDDDLRFTPDEARALFHRIGIDVGDDDLRRLGQLTEGWAAGLQLAALWLAARPDVDGLVEAFATSDRGVADFLVNEVIDLQPPDVAEFLMTTSVLETFDGALCDAVTGRADSGELLQQLHRAHLFLIELDRRAGWYRYHHLFGAFLQARLRTTSQQRFRAAHTAASRAFVDLDVPITALRHAMAADDVDGAIQLVRTLAASNLDVEDRLVALDAVRSWLRQHGERCIEIDAGLVLDCCVVLNALGALDDAEHWLRRIDRRRDTLNREDAALLIGVWGFHALHRGDPERALEHINEAQGLLGDEVADHFWLAQSPVVSGHAHLLLADGIATRETVQRARRASMTAAFTDAVRFPGFLALAGTLTGEFPEAARHAHQAIDAARSMKLDEANLAWVLPHLSLAALARERDDLVAAARWMALAAPAAEQSHRPPINFLCALERARLAMAHGQRAEASAALDDARSAMPAATRAVTDQIDQLAARWAVDAGWPNATDLVDGLLPGAARTFLEARAAIAAGDRAGAIRMLDPMAAALDTHVRRIEHGLLTARALATNDRDAALVWLAHALRLAESVGAVRIVVDEGADLHLLLAAVSTDARLERFVARVLSAAPVHTVLRRASAGQLVEPLSDRELDVLRYLASRLTYGEMAGHLFISVNTLKTHVKAVYRKLGASTRAEAVDRARQAGLL
jgi:LuxR family transcriptional regulator, maltose regulon positive regulatory protein